jgi:hypothetical protein
MTAASVAGDEESAGEEAVATSADSATDVAEEALNDGEGVVAESEAVVELEEEDELSPEGPPKPLPVLPQDEGSAAKMASLYLKMGKVRRNAETFIILLVPFITNTVLIYILFIYLFVHSLSRSLFRRTRRRANGIWL